MINNKGEKPTPVKWHKTQLSLEALLFVWVQNYNGKIGWSLTFFHFFPNWRCLLSRNVNAETSCDTKWSRQHGWLDGLAERLRERRDRETENEKVNERERGGEIEVGWVTYCCLSSRRWKFRTDKINLIIGLTGSLVVLTILWLPLTSSSATGNCVPFMEKKYIGIGMYRFVYYKIELFFLFHSHHNNVTSMLESVTNSVSQNSP